MMSPERRLTPIEGLSFIEAPSSTTQLEPLEDGRHEESISVRNTYSFECSIQADDSFKKSIEETSKPIKDAQMLIDKLNDLIEEYHAPGAPRRERRAIKREFDRIFRILQKHCAKHNIRYSFQKQ